MRIAAGVLIIIVSLTLPAAYQGIVESLAKARGVDPFGFMSGWGSLVFILLFVLVVSGICAFRRKYWWLALSGAICAFFIGLGTLPFVFVPMGILAVIFLVKRKSEFD
ncbi:hypothetical protein ACFLVW_06680 [Chloroflexota bacterium]